MAAPEIKVDYELLQAIAANFQQLVETNNDRLRRLRAVMDDLEADGWKGRGSDTFFQEMHDEVLPKTRRLIHALDDSAAVTKAVARQFRESEEQAANRFMQT